MITLFRVIYDIVKSGIGIVWFPITIGFRTIEKKIALKNWYKTQFC